VDREMRVWLAFVAAGLLTVAAGCGGGGSVAGPSPVPEAVTAPVVRLAPPAKLRGQWAEAADAAHVPGDHNVVVITPSYAKDDTETVARELAARRLPVIVFAGHIYHNRPETWDAAWTRFAQYLEPFDRAGVLVGLQPLDEPAGYAWGHMVPRAYAHAKARRPDLRQLLTEIPNYVDESGPYRLDYRGSYDWFHLTCYPYAQTRWNLETCEQEYREHPEWDAAILDGIDSAAWVRMAERQGRGWLIWPAGR